jgi:hypothetical protein
MPPAIRWSRASTPSVTDQDGAAAYYDTADRLGFLVRGGRATRSDAGAGLHHV